ncbi:MAG: hypothetical protein HYU41_14185 [Candidatus Rokubacteria bacterium]|nr:hypothetical protein [Candidatus Rokubacteria bacterium]
MIELETLVLPATVVLTSLGGYALARRGFRLPARQLRVAVGWMLECIGLTVGFLIVNVAVGAALVHVFRLLTPRFVAIYAATDTVLIPLSLVQALILCGWRAARTPNAGG